jgi:membrane protein
VEERPFDAPGSALLTVPNLSPETRRKQALRRRAGLSEQFEKEVRRHWRIRDVIVRVWAGAWNDGFIHAGNFAYTSIVALFPFFITVTAIFSAIGERDERAASINAFLLAVPPVVSRAIAPVARDVIEARTGWLLWIGGLVGLWTVSSLIETIRDMLRRAYGTQRTHAFWRYRLLSTGIIFGTVVLLLFSLFAQVALGAAEQAIYAWFPRLDEIAGDITLSRIIPALVLYGSLYLLFYTLTPSAYRHRCYPKWPGALFVALWWAAVTFALPLALRSVFNYDLTYGSLAGVMITLFFFWLVGLGMVIGAELNAALAESPEERDMIGQADNRTRAARIRVSGE